MNRRIRGEAHCIEHSLGLIPVFTYSSVCEGFISEGFMLTLYGTFLLLFSVILIHIFATRACFPFIFFMIVSYLIALNDTS